MKLEIEEFIRLNGRPEYYALPVHGVQEVDETNRTAVLLISTDAPNRRGHIVNPHGADLSAYRNNPVFMWNHLGHDNAAAIIGRTLEITQRDHSIIARVQYAELDNNPLPNLLWELERNGLLPANSIGLRPLGDLSVENGVTTIGAWELIDISKVGVGADARASNLLLP